MFKFFNCRCGLAGGCDLCRSNDIDKYNYSNLPIAQREGWVCTKCKTSNNPDNKTCEKCDTQTNWTGSVTFVECDAPVSSSVVSSDRLKDVPWSYTDGNHGFG